MLTRGRQSVQDDRSSSPTQKRLGKSQKIAHPIAQLLSHIYSTRADELDVSNVLSWHNRIAQDSMDGLARSLKADPIVRPICNGPVADQSGIFHIFIRRARVTQRGRRAILIPIRYLGGGAGG